MGFLYCTSRYDGIDSCTVAIASLTSVGRRQQRGRRGKCQARLLEPWLTKRPFQGQPTYLTGVLEQQPERPSEILHSTSSAPPLDFISTTLPCTKGFYPGGYSPLAPFGRELIRFKLREAKPLFPLSPGSW